MDIWVKIGIAAIVLHLVIGFGWLVFKLSPRREAGKAKKDNDH